LNQSLFAEVFVPATAWTLNLVSLLSAPTT
jgi:hypothetical protein